VKCKECRAGGYCSAQKTQTCDGGFTPCPVGTFNDEMGATNATSCLSCPTGTFSDNKEGLVQCLQCPYRLSSEPNNTVCSFCDKYFYLKIATVKSTELNKKPDNFCLPCPVNANCDRNTTIKTMKGNRGFWHNSLDSQKYYACENDEVCEGAKCAEGYEGVLCELCIDEIKYFNRIDGKCMECPHLSRLVIPAGIIAVTAIFTFGAHVAAANFPSFGHIVPRSVALLSNINLQTKMKITISFFQVISSLQDVYGVRLNSQLWGWINIFTVIQLNFFDIVIPGSYIDSMQSRIILSAVWLFFMIVIIVFFLFARALAAGIPDFKSNFQKFLNTALYVTILMLYLALPSVSNSIFRARKCRAFDTNDSKKLSNGYLIEDWSIECGMTMMNIPACQKYSGLFLPSDLSLCL